MPRNVVTAGLVGREKLKAALHTRKHQSTYLHYTEITSDIRTKCFRDRNGVSRTYLPSHLAYVDSVRVRSLHIIRLNVNCILYFLFILRILLWNIGPSPDLLSSIHNLFLRRFRIAAGHLLKPWCVDPSRRTKASRTCKITFVRFDTA
jgi:hypothetical protein